jgi:hypothetical protein
MSDDPLAGLSAKAKRELYARLAYELRSTEPITPDEQAFWTALTGAMVGAGIRGAPTLDMFVKSVGRGKLTEASDWVGCYVDDSCDADMRKPVRQAVMQTAFKCLIKYMGARGIPVNPTTILGQIDVMQHAVDIAFPGYSAARLLHRVAPVERKVAA